MRKLRVLVGCEFSGVVRRAFRELGHDAWSCDLLPAEDGGPHFQNDVFDVINSCIWDLLIFHWPCTHMLLSGVRWFTTIPKHPKPGILYGKDRFLAMERDASSFKSLLNCGIQHIAGENPTMCGKAQKIIGQKWSQKIQPWMFGHPESKATFLWTKDLPLLMPTNIVYDDMMKLPKKERERIHYMSPGENRGLERSRTYPGIAQAMAVQYSEYILSQPTL